MALTLTTDEQTELERRASSRTIRAEDAKRAKVILMLANGPSYSTIEATLSLFAALNTQTGEVLGQTVPRRTSDAFVAFLGEIVASQPRGGEIHVILDNLSTHRT